MTLPRYAYPRAYGDFVPGTVIEHAQRRVVTETDNLLYSRLCGHEHPYFFAYGAADAARRAAVNPFVVLGIVGGLAVRATSRSAIANLGWKSIAFPQCAYVGDELRAITEIVDKRVSRSDSRKGIITIRTTGLTGRDHAVSVATRSFLVEV